MGIKMSLKKYCDILHSKYTHVCRRRCATTKGLCQVKQITKSREKLGSGWVGQAQLGFNFNFGMVVFFVFFVLFSCFQMFLKK